MTRLLYIVNRIDGPGGLERVLSIKASCLADEYLYDIHILTLNQDNNELFYSFSKKITYHNISAKGNAIKYLLAYKKGIKDVIKKINPEIILVCDDGLKGLLLPLIIKNPSIMIYERHVSKKAAMQNDNPTIWRKLINYFILKLMDFGGSQYDKFVVLTNGNKKEWSLNNIEVIPNPLSFFPEVQSNLKSKKVLAVGKQSYQKGYDRLLKSWKLINEKHPNWVLDIYGTISSDEKLEELASDLGISKSVNFFQPVKNIADKYKEASIYVMSSRYEGFGMVLTEAMAYGVPCVSFDCPYGPSDIIKNNEDGFLVPNGDIEDLSNKLMCLIENEDLRYGMGKQARQNVERFLPKNILNQWDSLFKQLTRKA